MTVSLDTLWTFLLNFDIWGFVQAVFIGTSGELFYGIIVLATLLIIYGRTENVTYVAIVWVFMSPILLVMVPMAGWGLGAIILYLSLGGMIGYLFLRTLK